MLKFSDYITDRPDLPYDNFAQLLDGIEKKNGHKDAVLYRAGGEKEFTRWSFNRFAEECRRIARGLLEAGLVKGDKVVLWSENRPQWMSVWMGTVIAGICIVPVDFLITEQECLNIIEITKAKALFYSGRKKSFADSLKSKGIKMNAAVCISPENENASPNTPTEYSQFGINAAGVELPPIDSIPYNHPASIVFTSGTTGFAKGVTLSHKNIIANTSAAICILDPKDHDVFIDVLPLHHTYPTTCSFMAPLASGIPVVIAEKIVGKVVVDDIRDGGVTFLIGVPLLYDKVMTAIEAKYNKIPIIVRGPLNVLRKIALAKARKGNPNFGRKVFRFIRKKAGLQSIYIMVAGGGPLSIKTADFFDSLGFNMVQGYGMSENSPLITVNTPYHKRNESVGLPVSHTQVKILNAGTDGIGEITCKSPSVMLGYYENEEATKEVITDDGWLLTGDLGIIDELGFVHIRGRKKNLIIGAGGKNVYPEEVESNFNNSLIIGEILIVGKKDTSFGGEVIFAIIVPNYDCIKENYPGKETDDAFIRDLINNEIKEVNRTLPVYKKISDFAVRKEPFEKNAQQKIRRFLYSSYSAT